MRRLLVVVVVLLSFATSWSQQYISFKPIIYGYHPYADPNNEIAPKAVGSSGTFAIEPGAIFGYDHYFFRNFLGAKINTGIYVDNASKMAGFVHLMARLRTTQEGQSFMLGFGPAFYFREGWYDVAGYVDDEAWNNGDKLQTKFSLFSLELEYAQTIGKHHTITFAFTQISLQTYSFSLGYSYWIPKPKFRNKRVGGRSKYYRRK